MQQHSAHTDTFLTCGKFELGKDQPECVDPTKQVSFDCNNAPLGVKVYCFIPRLLSERNETIRFW